MIQACELCGEKFVAGAGSHSDPASLALRAGRCPSCCGPAATNPYAHVNAPIAAPPVMPPPLPPPARPAAPVQAQPQTAHQPEPARGARRRGWELAALLLAAAAVWTLADTLAVPASPPSAGDTPSARAESRFDISLRGLPEPLQLTRLDEPTLEAPAVAQSPAPRNSAEDIVARTLETVPRAHVAGLTAGADDLAGAGNLALVPIGGPRGVTGSSLGLMPVGAGGGGLGKATFMGVTAIGQRFCIIADRSGSMAGPKLDFVKAEILQTLGDLKSGSKFYIIFYNHAAEPVPVDHWLMGRNDAVKVARWMNDVGPEGNTNPLPAFQIAFNLNPRPDVIFFMTDGLFPREVATFVAAMNSGRKKIPVHAISFVDRSAEATLKQIADDSKGTYRHVDHP